MQTPKHDVHKFCQNRCTLPYFQFCIMNISKSFFLFTKQRQGLLRTHDKNIAFSPGYHALLMRLGHLEDMYDRCRYTPQYGQLLATVSTQKFD